MAASLNDLKTQIEEAELRILVVSAAVELVSVHLEEDVARFHAGLIGGESRRGGGDEQSAIDAAEFQIVPELRIESLRSFGSEIGNPFVWRQGGVIEEPADDLRRNDVGDLIA